MNVLSLFVIGGLWAWMHKTETDPRKLFQLGIVAPAMITAMMNTANMNVKDGEQHAFDLSFSIVSTAYAAHTSDKAKTTQTLSPLDKFIRGFLKRR